MRKSHRLRLATSIAIICISSAHADCADQKPIQRMLCNSAMGQFQILIAKDAGLSGVAAGNEAAKLLDEDIEGAVKEAGKRAELSRAVKAYYSAASAYFDNPVQRNKDQLTSAEKSLDLEMKLASAKPAKR